jgi:hypothetical protein
MKAEAAGAAPLCAEVSLVNLTLNRIRSVLESQFGSVIDMSDCASHAPDVRHKAMLSRALAALCIKQTAGVDVAAAAQAVTDGYEDNGLDAIYFDPRTDTLLLVQSKWSDTGTKPIDLDGANAFVKGVRDLLSGSKLDRFNTKVRAKAPDIRTALYADRTIRIRLITVHSANQATAPHVRRPVDDLVDEINNPVGVGSAEHIDQAGVYGLITAESTPLKIKLQIGLNKWGVVEKPFLAYYGHIHVGEIAQWWKDHSNFLFVQNLRHFYYNSDVNDALKKTLAHEPEYFWYFNNGITVICDSVVKGLAGSTDNQVGIFTCQGVSVVNGAQTVGSIGGVIGSIPDGAEKPQGWVQVRIISLEKCPPEFARRLTRAANLQNAVGNREFAAMDPLQYRLATDFSLDRRKYVYKSGEPEPQGSEGCSIVEATQALACAVSVTLAVQAKREIGALWASTENPPYTDIFPHTITTARVWRSVLIMRAVDEELQKLRSSELPRADLIAVHMNRIILHLVFQDPKVRPLNHDGTTDAEIVAAARAAVSPIFSKVVAYMEREHQNEYPAPLSKNTGKCEKLVANYSGSTAPDGQTLLDLKIPGATEPSVASSSETASGQFS